MSIQSDHMKKSTNFVFHKYKFLHKNFLSKYKNLHIFFHIKYEFFQLLRKKRRDSLLRISSSNRHIWLKLLVSVLFWCHTILLFKSLYKITGIIKSNTKCNICDVKICCTKQFHPHHYSI